MSAEPLSASAPDIARPAFPRHLAIYLAVALPVCLLFHWRTDVVSMEGIIALGGRHMLESGDWLVPRLYGEIYAFKPPLAYWLAAGTEALFGRQTEFTLRLPTALCGLALGLAFLVGMGRMVGPRCGLYSALAAITTGLFIEQIDTAGFEMPLVLGFSVSMLAACRNLAFEHDDWRVWMLGYTGLLVAFLAKGLPAIVLFLPGLVVGSITVGQWTRLLGGRHLAGAALFLAGAGAFAASAYRAEGAAAFHQHLGEIMLRSERWTWGRLLQTLAKPVVIFAVLLPWSVVVTGWLLEVISRRIRHIPRWSQLLARAAERLLPLPLSDTARRPARVAWAFLFVGVLAFMAVPTDDTRYYLALCGPLAMIAGLSIERLPNRWPERTAVALTAAGLIVWVVQAAVVQPRRAEKRSLRTVADAFRSHVPADATVYVDTQDSYSSLFYYLDRPVQAWRWGTPVPAEGSYVVFDERERPMLDADSGLELRPLIAVDAPDRHRYVLSRLSRAGP